MSFGYSLPANYHDPYPRKAEPWQQVFGQPNSYTPVPGSPGTFGPAPAPAPAPAAHSRASPPGTSAPTAGAGGVGYDPAVTLGPDGNLYGYLRTYDATTGSYGYKYASFGPATDLATASRTSGIPVGMLQQAVVSQGVQNRSNAFQSAANPYLNNGLTQQQASQGVDAQNTAFQYANQPTLNQSALASANMNNNAYANYTTANPYTGMNNGQTALAAGNVGSAVNLTKDSYQMAAGPGTNGQSRLAYQQGTQDITDPYERRQAAYNATNQTADLQLRDLNRQYDTTAGQYNTSGAAYTNGQTRQQYTQGTQDLQNPYNRSNAAFQLANQPQQQSLDLYRQGLQTQQAQTTDQSRNLQGVGWASISRPIIAGT